MSDFDDMVRRAQADLAGHVLPALRARLMAQPREWLVDQLLAEAAARLGGVPAQRPGESGHLPRPLTLDEQVLAEHTARLGAFDTSACLVDPPPPGGAMIGPAQRTAHGEDLLRLAKDLLYAALFGEPTHGVLLDRVRQESITLTVPRWKAEVFTFIHRGPTDLDSDGAIHLSYGEVEPGVVSDAVVAALRVINRLEINEEVLYARMIEQGQGTLI
ncbi:hypothetical protein V5P93_000508 [Actinokineospora auranticolor]|uniref:Uncharacterized protein n=1 Tax=Actinokineospora auranticolor TaxID=155976 RepID=A0A2S6GZD4_9PSEU|nr:hypothetical protein [Actinokineospora auranticolor]PPK70612.1 hypothetical protein CLV40_102529 [Actinokineospora auranticolor]